MGLSSMHVYQFQWQPFFSQSPNALHLQKIHQEMSFPISNFKQPQVSSNFNNLIPIKVVALKSLKDFPCVIFQKSYVCL